MSETPVKNKLQLEQEYEDRRRKAVDDKNKADAATSKLSKKKLANTPLSTEEAAFCVETKAKMSNGRRADAPCAADVLRYSRLKGRMDIPQQAMVDQEIADMEAAKTS